MGGYHVLQVLAVHPAHRRREHAHRLLAVQNELLDEAGLDACAHPPASSQFMFPRHGYEPVGPPIPLYEPGVHSGFRLAQYERERDQRHKRTHAHRREQPPDHGGQD